MLMSCSEPLNNGASLGPVAVMENLVTRLPARRCSHRDDRPKLSLRVQLDLGLGVARRVGQRFGPWSRPPHAAVEAVSEALFPARAIELRQTCSGLKWSHGFQPGPGGRSLVKFAAMR